MQYKIPVQIEMADKIVLGLSLKQLTIILIGGGITYQMGTTLAQKYGGAVAAAPTIFLGLLIGFIVIFKRAEMTFFPYILSAIRYSINLKERQFVMGTDSFQPIDIGFVTSQSQKTEKDIDFDSKIDKINKLESKLEKI